MICLVGRTRGPALTGETGEVTAEGSYIEVTHIKKRSSETWAASAWIKGQKGEYEVKNVKWKNETIASQEWYVLFVQTELKGGKAISGQIWFESIFLAAMSMVGSARVGWWVVQDGRVCKYIETGDFQRWWNGKQPERNDMSFQRNFVCIFGNCWIWRLATVVPTWASRIIRWGCQLGSQERMCKRQESWWALMARVDEMDERVFRRVVRKVNLNIKKL